MTYLLMQIFIWLVVAALIGAIAAWFLRRNIALQREDAIQQEWKARIRQLEIERDRNVHKRTAEFDRLKNSASQSESTMVLENYERQANQLNEQIAEREQVIAELRSEIQSLRDEVLESSTATKRRETNLLQQHEQALANLAQEHDDQVTASELQVSNQEHQDEISRLNSLFEQRESEALADQVTTLREQHDQDLDNLKLKLQQLHKDETSRLENQVSQLRMQLAQQAMPGSESVPEQIRQLQAKINQRDDSIAVLRDDLAQLNEKRAPDQRGRQDQQLRAAFDESAHWQGKYEQANAELEELRAATRETGRAVNSPDPKVVIESVKSKHQRSSGDRIGSVLSHPGGPRDKLQEIKGIGPVLERKLNDVGIYHFKQIAELDADDIARLSNELGRLAGRIVRDAWVEQARALHTRYHG